MLPHVGCICTNCGLWCGLCDHRGRPTRVAVSVVRSVGKPHCASLRITFKVKGLCLVSSLVREICRMKIISKVYPRRQNVITSMVGLRNSHIHKNLTQNGDPQRSSRGIQKKKNSQSLFFPRLSVGCRYDETLICFPSPSLCKTKGFYMI